MKRACSVDQSGNGVNATAGDGGNEVDERGDEGGSAVDEDEGIWVGDDNAGRVSSGEGGGQAKREDVDSSRGRRRAAALASQGDPTRVGTHATPGRAPP